LQSSNWHTTLGGVPAGGPGQHESELSVSARLRHLLPALLCLLLAVPAAARTTDAGSQPGIEPAFPLPEGSIAQRDGMTLSEAVESVRRRGDVERVISAETHVNNGREMHHIRVMTKDGKITTFKIGGRQRS
jgi:hypothetical protein